MKLQDIVKRLEALRLEPRLYIGDSALYQEDWMSVFADMPEHTDIDGKLVPRQSLICFGLHLNGKPRDDEASYAAKLADPHITPKLARYAAAVVLADHQWAKIKESMPAHAHA